ncbi:Protein of uncharacterised function, DUF393 [Kingella potus]|uniref:Protein of uncharacterized function, DUF393 n=1 Tax=Kingella potus TaxID=265175 RepID=A0A377R337_9NEIS|nr:DUF393 domain-containing protein [Kingella potus]UOP00230.1 DUF393 domain-containing protein [Kingella potus]STR02713.1 Protein of uncharacterised function, DUF393 [Kingella potus]
MKHQIFYDAQCPLCVREMELVLSDRRAAEFEPVPVQDSGETLQRHGITPAEAMTYLHILRADGTMVRGMAAVRLMHEHATAFTLIKLANLPFVAPLADRLYPWFARHRYRFPRWLLPRPACQDGVCCLAPEKRMKK